jgi:hypothetical protein
MGVLRGVSRLFTLRSKMLFVLELELVLVLELELELELVVDAVGNVSSVGLSGVLSVDLFLLERRRAGFGLSSRSLSTLEILLARGIILYIQENWTLT